jgi:hypothetical protein
MMTRRLVLGAGLAMGASGCWGGFGLTKKLYDWNATIGNKWVVWLVFFLFFILPVYGVCTLVDALVINSIEFWSGSNPLGNNAPSPAAEKTIEHEDGSRITFTRVNDTTMRVVRRDPSGEFLDGYEMVMEGDKAGQMRALDGTILVTNERLADGTLAVTYNGETTLVTKAQQEQVAASKNYVVAAGELLPNGLAVAMR